MMLSVPINGQVQSRLIPPTFVEDNISDMFKAVDAGHNIVVTAVDELAAFFIDLNDPSTIEAVLWSDGEHEFLDSGCEYRY